AAFVGFAIVAAARRVRLDLVGLAPGDVNPAAVRLPTGNTRSEMLVGIGDPLVVFLAIFVFIGIGIGIAPSPEFLDKALALVVGRELLESFPLFDGDDVGDVLVQPILVSFFQFRLNIARLLGGVLALVVFALLSQA